MTIDDWLFMAMRSEPVRYRATDGVMRLGTPYDDMVSRLHDRVLELLVPARAGNRSATLDAARRVMDQCSALVELLEGKLGTKDEVGSTK